MPRNKLSDNQLGKLKALWLGGMTTKSKKDLIMEAVESTGLDEKVIKNWIGNEKKRRGLVVKRSKPPAREVKTYIEGKPRKKSAFSVFKSEFLAKEAKTMIAEGVGAAEVQRRGNIAYQSLDVKERQIYQKRADDTNSNSVQVSAVSRTKLVRKIVSNIHANMQKLDELGCQSIWIGFCGAQPQRLYSPQMADLAEDETLTNFVVSAMVNKLAKAQMNANTPTTSRSKKTSSGTSNADASSESAQTLNIEATTVRARGSKRKKGSSIYSDIPGSTEHKKAKGSNSHVDSSVPGPCALREGDLVQMLNQESSAVGEAVVGSQKKVHGRDILQGWVPLMVTEILPSIRPWPEYPTHSDVVESGSFVAWPEQYLCRRGERRHYSKEVEVLRDPLHPDKDVSPRTLVSRDRQLRERTKAS